MSRLCSSRTVIMRFAASALVSAAVAAIVAASDWLESADAEDGAIATGVYAGTMMAASGVICCAIALVDRSRATAEPLLVDLEDPVA
jgi:hypothetical protein